MFFLSSFFYPSVATTGGLFALVETKSGDKPRIFQLKKNIIKFQ